MAHKGGETSTQSRNLSILAKDIMEGFLMLNPLVLKKYDHSTCKELFRQLRRLQTTIRIESVNLANQAALRTRNHRLQRMSQAIGVLEHHARLNRIPLG